jgi:hypothetical protein
MHRWQEKIRISCFPGMVFQVIVLKGIYFHCWGWFGLGWRFDRKRAMAFIGVVHKVIHRHQGGPEDISASP